MADRGPQGDPGRVGDPGRTGERGLTGKTGDSGEQGKDGKVGHDGQSGERVVRNGVVVLVVLTLFLAFLATMQTLRMRNLGEVLYDRCAAKEAADIETADARMQLAWQLGEEIEQERTNKFIDDELRMKRISTKTKTKAAFELSAARTYRVVGGCGIYRQGWFW